SEALKPIVKEYHLSGITTSKIEETGRTVYKAENIPAIKQESLSPPFNTIAPKLSARLANFSYKGYDAQVNNWNDLGKWLDENLLKGRTDLPENTKFRAKSLVQGIEDDLEKAKIIYKYVQDNTRYISVQIGIGGFQPISAIDVDRVKYGDCKGLSNYTKALLEVVGVKSYYTVVEAGNTKVDFDEDFADLIQGNHAILAIPYNNGYHWIDCTSQVHPFGFVGDFTDDRKVLIVKPNGGEIVKTVSYLNEQNHQKTMAAFSLTKEGGILAEVVIDTKGVQYDNRFHLEKDPKEDVIKHYKDYWKNINNLKVQAYEFKNDRDAIVFTEEIKISAINYGTKSGDRLLFTANAFNKNQYVPRRYRNRKLPFEIQRGHMDEDEYTITLPDGYDIEAIPEGQSFENEFGSYSMSTKLNDDKKSIVYKRTLLIKKGLYPKEKYKEYRNFRKTAASMDNMQIVLIKNH
ncbi:MAG: DUF3858 domain-containing protein, partial [Saonia sp.]